MNFSAISDRTGVAFPGQADAEEQPSVDGDAVNKKGVMVVASVLAFTAATVLILVASQAARTSEPVARDSSQDSRSGTPPLSPARAARIGVELRSGDAGRVRDALAVPDGQELDRAFVETLAELEDLTIDPSSFEPLGATAAQATAQVRRVGKDSSTWTVDLVLVDETWKVAGTRVRGGGQ